MRTHLAVTIRSSRRAAGLTQEQLGRRLGLRGRAIYRWERGDSRPSRRHRQALVMALDAVHRNAAAQLAAVLAGEAAPGTSAAPTPTATPTPGSTAPAPTGPRPSPAVALELALFHMADELDVPPGRIRGSLARLLERLRAADITVDAAQAQIEAWMASAP